MTEPAFDVPVANRWFAVECNNAAWDLVETAKRSAEDTARMLHLAHAAAWHWSQVGKPINQVRAVNLLATAYLAAHQLVSAVDYAEQGLRMATSLDGELTDFDRACLHGAAAAAYRLAGRRAEAAREEAAARVVAAALDADDRLVFERLYPRPA